MSDNQAQASSERVYDLPTPINSVKDLADYLNRLLARNKYAANCEIHAEYEPSNYRLVMSAKLIDDELILTLDRAESDPFEHEE